jgi:hypothetical protein
MEFKVNGHKAETKIEKELVKKLEEVLKCEEDYSVNGNFNGVHIYLHEGEMVADNGEKTLIITWV